MTRRRISNRQFIGTCFCLMVALLATETSGGSLHSARDTVNFTAPDSLLSPDADTFSPTASPSQLPTPQPTPTPTPQPTKTYKPSAAPVISWEPTVSLVPSLEPSSEPTVMPSNVPTISVAPTATKSPTMPTPVPSQAPTTWEPTHSPTLLPTTELEMFGQRLAIGLSFVFVVVAYAVHSLTKPSELAQRGLDHTLFRIREFRVEKRWGCKFCGFVKNEASSPECMQCGTNQLGEQEILPVNTAKGHVLEKWRRRTPELKQVAPHNDNSSSSSNRKSMSAGSSSKGANGGDTKRRLSYSKHEDEPMLKGYSVDDDDDGGGGGHGGRKNQARGLVVLERENWPFALGKMLARVGGGVGGGSGGRQAQTPPTTITAAAAGGGGGGVGRGGLFGKASELPVALALSEIGFVVADLGRSGATMGGAAALNHNNKNNIKNKTIGSAGGSGTEKKKKKWGVERHPEPPSGAEAAGHLLEWCCTNGGIASSVGLPPELLGLKGGAGGSGLDDARRAFFPEKAAWFYERLRLLKAELSDENVKVEHATAYPNSVLRDSVGFLNKVTPVQVLLFKYRVQFVSAKSHTRSTAVEGELEEKWLQSLFAQFGDPDTGVVAVGHDGSLELKPAPRLAVAAAIKAANKTNAAGSSSSRSSVGDGGGGFARTSAGRRRSNVAPKKSFAERAALVSAAQVKAAEPGGADASRLLLFSALGRAMAMALVQRSFVGLSLSPVLCKLLVGQPVHFMDLLGCNQDLFQDLLRLVAMGDEGVAKLHLVMPDTTTDGGGEGVRNSLRDGVQWDGRGTKPGEVVDSSNRLEYVFRMLEDQCFLKWRPEFAALRRALFEVIPQELLSVFDHKEFLMLLNGHHTSASGSPDLFTVSV